MRYFYYKDSRLAGPLSADEIRELGGLEADALVCPEDASGRRDEDWRAAGEVSELSAGLRSSLTTALVDEPLPGAEAGFLERLELESLGVPREDGDEWLAGFLDDAEFRTRWGLVLPKTEDSPQQLSTAQNRIRELSDQLASFQKRIKELEAQQRELLSQLRGNAQTGRFEAVASPPAPAEPKIEPPSSPELEASAAAPPAVEPALPSIAIRKTETPAGGSPPSQPPSAGPLAAGAQTEFQKRAFKFKPPQPKAEPPKPAVPKLGAAKSFRVIKKEEPPPPTGPVYEWTASSPPAGGLPEAKKAAPLPEPPSSGKFDLPEPRLPSAPGSDLRFNAPTPVPPPPVTMQIKTTSASGAPEPGVPSLQPPPVPTLTPLTPESAPGSGSPPSSPFAGPQLGSAGPAFTPSRSNAEPVATPGFDLSPKAPFSAAAPASDVLKRLAKPEAPKTAEKPKPRNSKVFLIASGVLVLVLIASFAFFLRSPKDLKTMVNMGVDHKPLGAAGEEAVPLPPKPKDVAPAPAPVPAPAPAPAPTLPASGSPSQAGVDQRQAAIDLVKGYPLDGDRGTVSQRLSFMFMADPESGNVEDWSAGAVEANVYVVQYRVIPGPKSQSKEAINYVFEADVARGTVKGSNGPAHELMAGPTAAPRPKPKKGGAARPAAKRKTKVVRAPEPPKEVPLMPLPSDSELLPPAEGDSQFKSDTVQ